VVRLRISRLSGSVELTLRYTTPDIHCRHRRHECDGGIMVIFDGVRTFHQFAWTLWTWTVGVARNDLHCLLQHYTTDCSVASATRRCHTAPVNTHEGWRVVAWWRDGPARKGCRAGPVCNAYRAARHAAIALADRIRFQEVQWIMNEVIWIVWFLLPCKWMFMPFVVDS